MFFDGLVIFKGKIFGKYCGLNKMDTWHNSERTKV